MKLEWKKSLENEVEILRQARDELRVQLHLGAAEAKDAWGQAEQSWGHLEARLRQVRDATHDSAGEIEAATESLLEEIKTGYRRIRNAL